MMDSIKKWINDLPIDFNGKTLDIGSLDVNGSVREYFKKYEGIDIRQGKNVDKVLSGHDILKHYREKYFKNVLYLETMEHDSIFWYTLININKVLVKGGNLVLTVPGINFHQHNHPKDYWRFTKDGVINLINYIDFKVVDLVEEENHCKEKHIFCLAKK